MDDWIPIQEFPSKEQNKLRWLLRHAAENGIVGEGVAMKFGREWRVNKRKLPGFLCELTRKRMGASAG